MRLNSTPINKTQLILNPILVVKTHVLHTSDNRNYRQWKNELKSNTRLSLDCPTGYYDLILNKPWLKFIVSVSSDKKAPLLSEEQKVDTVDEG